ncbi:MAG: phosphate ABC transporter substrate-binding protein PstS family protein [Actinomycetota bacterium]
MPAALLLLLLVLVGAAACGGSDAGDVTISGSSTVEPISSAVAEAFLDDYEEPVAISVDGPGTGDGFERFCNGEVDVADASRPIEPEEVETCEANGIGFVELKVAVDGITVVTSPEFDEVSCLSFADLYALVGPESVGVDRWSEAGDFPDERLVITAPGEESGTYDTFVELALDGDPVRPDYQASPNDNVIVEAVRGTSSSLGWLGFSFFEQNAEQLRAFEIDGGDGCVAPTAETIADGSYPLARPLFLYVSLQSVDDEPAVVDYVSYYLHDGIGKVAEVGYVPLTPDDLEATRQAWQEATA